ncbi:rhodanese-like domain-containing protein [Salinigranum halophilum]|jgi:rhodanese-related sulfurtransferase|uniref:rhodanese-like domain-containing protein n=1 Tax=Salinigranum halophilum TaxID=2565931 RepID=UPI00115E554E|nr:rhodanese-like domain-containing protein [Salinigranum halophilum]
MSDTEADFEVDRKAWDMADAADEQVETVTVAELQAELDAQAGDETDVVVLDVRDIREAWIEGGVPGAKHAPRGMIEWWADPSTKYYKPFFHPSKRYVVYCNEAGRSALVAKTLGEMGYDDVAHLEGGFTAWKEQGGAVEEVPQRDYK